MADDGQTLHYEGVLEKAGKRFFEGFRKRWFILHGKNLSYYKAANTTPENLLGIIDLTKVKAVNPFKMINNNAFQIITSMRTYTFTAATPELMTEWISVLRQAMQIESFTSKRSKRSVRRANSMDDNEGYEEVSRVSSTASETSMSDALYDDIASATSSSKKTVPVGTYESVGSIIRSSEDQRPNDYDSVSPVSTGTVGTTPKSVNSEQFGSYGVVGIPQPQPQTQNIEDMYATVDKKRPKAEPATTETECEATYDEVGAGEPKPLKITEDVTPMPIICESDDDEDEEGEEEDNDDAFVDEQLNNLQDPLPPPKGDSYAIDQIKNLLKDFKGDEKIDVQENIDDINENNIIPESCEKAFLKLREFLAQLDNGL